MSTSHTSYRLLVAGPLSGTAVGLIDNRFGSAAAVARAGLDSAVDLTGDQPALRALLTLLWDLGHDLIAVWDLPGASRPGTACPLLPTT